MVKQTKEDTSECDKYFYYNIETISVVLQQILNFHARLNLFNYIYRFIFTAICIKILY